MLRTILAGLDGSEHSRAAVELGIRWAKRNDCLLVGLGVVDEPHIAHPEPVPLGAGAYKEMLDANRLNVARQKIEAAVEAFTKRCEEAGVRSKALIDVGDPADCITKEAQRYDLIVLGQKTYFRLDTHPGETLLKLLKRPPRPVVAAPTTEPTGDEVVVAFDGSLQATRALQAFLPWAAELTAHGHPVHVVTIGPNQDDAARCCRRACDCLGFHDIQAHPHVIATSEAVRGALCQKLNELDTGLVVMGCYGSSVIKEFFLGSITQHMLDTSPAPMFLFQ